MKCRFCKDEIEAWDYNKKIKEHIIITRDKDSHLHVHGDIDDKILCKTLLTEAANEIGVEMDKPALNTLPKEIIFHNKQRVGDMLMFTCLVRDFKHTYPDTKVNIISSAPHIWDNNPYIDESVQGIEPVYIGPKYLTDASNRLDWHFANAFRLSAEKALGIQITQGVSKPDIWFTEDEWNEKPVIDDPYWIICIGGEKGWGCKMYPFYRFQSFVEQNTDILFVQIGAKGDNHPRLQGNNIIDYIGKTEDKDTGIRDMFKLALNSEGSIGLISFHMHLSGALDKPAIIIDGAREPAHFTNYPFQQRLRTHGSVKCASVGACWHCDISACKYIVENPDAIVEHDRKIPLCVHLIEPEDLTRALRLYYNGGILETGKRLAKPKQFKNIVKEKKIHQSARIVDIKKIDPIKTDDITLDFNAGSITQEDWVFIESVIDSYGIKNVLEFGSGLSTALLDRKGINVTSYETKEGWCKKLEKSLKNSKIEIWDGKAIDCKDTIDVTEYGLVFVDGPSGAQNREQSTQYASNHSDIIIIHDASRMHERTWQFRYLKSNFELSARGGSRCHLWIRNGKRNKELEKFKCFSVPKQENLDIIQDYIANGKILEIQSKQIVTKVIQPISTIAKVEPTVPVKQLYKPNLDKRELDRIVRQSKQSIKFIFNGRGEGGAERSCTWMMNTLFDMGHDVTYHTPVGTCGTFRKEGNKKIPVADCSSLNEQCDILVLYANDWVWNFNKPEIQEMFSNINAERKILCVNYKLDKIGIVPWTKEFDLYLFLNREFENELLSRLPNAKTKSMAPPTILDKYFDTRPDYNSSLKLIRHSSQGDAKYPKTFNEDVEKILALRNDVTIRLMPAPSFLKKFGDRVVTHPKNCPPVDEFLKLGNCYHYHTPSGYTEGGPKVVMEAQASGLPVIAANSSGMKDRVAFKTGWLCDSFESQLEVIKSLTPQILEEYGNNAREHARREYNPINWIKEILND